MQQVGIACVRLEGCMSLDQRDKAITVSLKKLRSSRCSSCAHLERAVCLASAVKSSQLCASSNVASKQMHVALHPGLHQGPQRACLPDESEGRRSGSESHSSFPRDAHGSVVEPCRGGGCVAFSAVLWVWVWIHCLLAVAA